MWRFFRWSLAGLVLALGSVVLWEAAFVRVASLADPEAVRTLAVTDGRGGERRLVVGPASAAWTPLDEVSPFVVAALLSAEDPCFLEHAGFDTFRLRRALAASWRNWRAGRPLPGASTITNQLMKNLFLWRDRSPVRKVLEAYLTWRAERTLGKERILELYLNVVEWGPGVYGIREASRHHFGETPDSLAPEQAAWLVSLLPNPLSRALPEAREAMQTRTERILHAMVARLRGVPPVCGETSVRARMAERKLRVVHPPDGYELRAPSTYVLGTAPPSVEVRVQGSPVVRSPAGHFAHAIALPEGELFLRVEAGARSDVRRIRRRPASVVASRSPSEVRPTAPAWAEVVEPLATVRDGPGFEGDPRTPLPRGTQVRIVATSGEWKRIETGGWIREDALRALRPGPPPTTALTGIRSGREGDRTILRLALRDRPPFEIRASGRELTLQLHRTVARTPSFPADADGIDSVEPTSPSPGITAIVVRLRDEGVSGFRTRWDEEGLRVEIRRLPARRPQAGALSGLSVVLDPGHGGAGDPGARGPTGHREADATLELARLLARDLRERGARVRLTREDDRALTLRERLASIRGEDPHVVLSLHYDAHADGQDPLRMQGAEVYWFHPHARSLARAVHDGLRSSLGRPTRGVRRRSLALTGPTSAAAILLELGLLTHPFEYEWIADPDARVHLSRALAESLVRWRETAS